MTKRAKKSSKLCSTDQRSIRKRNIAYKIHTLTVSPYENYLLGRRVFTLWLVSLGSQMWMMLNLVEIFPKSLKGFTYMISSSMKAFIWKKKKNYCNSISIHYLFTGLLQSKVWHQISEEPLQLIACQSAWSIQVSFFYVLKNYPNRIREKKQSPNTIPEFFSEFGYVQDFFYVPRTIRGKKQTPWTIQIVSDTSGT